MLRRYLFFTAVFGAIAIAISIFAVPVGHAAYGDTSTFIGQIYAGDGGQVLDAYFDFPDDMILDASGNFLIADTYNNVVRKVDGSGIVSTMAGTGSTGFINGASGSAEFYQPRALVAAANGDIYVADSANNAVRKISGGIVSTVVSSGLNSPLGLALAGTALYISDSGNNAIKYVSTSGGAVTTLATGVNDPRKLIVSADGSKLYVADNGNHRVVSIALPGGAVTVVAGSGTSGYVEGTGTAAQFQNVWGLVQDGTTLYVTDHDGLVTDRIRTINLNTGTTGLFAFDQYQRTMLYPGALVIKDGYLYAMMTGRGTIQRFLLTDSATTDHFGGVEAFSDTIGTNALVGRPLDLTLSPDGKYVYFSENNKVRKFDATTGEVLTVLGSITDGYREGTDAYPSPMRFSGPFGITVNSTGTRLYVADRNNNRIRGVLLDATPISSFLVSGAGLTNTTGTQDNGYQEGVKCEGELAQGVSGCAYFKNPAGIVIDPTNTYLYVTDTGNNRVRRVRISDGQTSLIAGSGTAGFADGAGSAAKFNRPFGIAIDSAGKFLYIADSNNHRIRKIDLATNTVSTLIGTGALGYANATPLNSVLSYPEYVDVTSNGNVYFTEAGSQRIRVFDIAANAVKLVAGSGTRGFLNGAASVAKFNNLKGLAVDTQKNKIFVADSWNDLIRAVNITGDIPYTDPAPEVAAVSPKNVNPAWNTGSGLKVQITGKNFRYNATVLFGNFTAEKTWVVSGTAIVAQLPLSKMSPGIYDVTVREADGQEATLEKGFNLTQTNNALSTTYFAYAGKKQANIAVAPGSSFFAFSSTLRGGFNVTSGNVAGDSKSEIIVGTGNGMNPEIRVFTNGGKLLSAFAPYSPSIKSGVRLYVCDVNGDGAKDIVTVPGPGAAPLVKVFSGEGKLESSFSALDGKFKGGAFLACGDVNGDGVSDIVVSAGKGGGPHVTAHSSSGKIIANFFAYDKNFRGGIRVATADIDGDGKEEIITGPDNGAPHIQTFQFRSGIVKRLNPGWFVFSRDYRGGVSVAGADVDGDGSKEIIVGVGDNATPLVKVLNKSGTLVKQFYAFATTFLGGVNIGGGDVDGDGLDEVLVLPRSGGGPNLRIINVEQLK